MSVPLTAKGLERGRRFLLKEVEGRFLLSEEELEMLRLNDVKIRLVTRADILR